MKKVLILSFIFFSLCFSFSVKNVFASGTAYTDITGTTHYSDGGTSYVDITGTTHFSNGCSSYTDITGTTHYTGGVGCGGSSYGDITGTTHFNFDNNTNGTAYTDITGTTHYNDNKGTSGSSYTDITGTTHYNGDIFIAHNCPSNSSYDSLSKKCKCSYGYVVGSSGQCISTASYCSSQLGYMSRYNSLSNKCECMSGYEYNGSSCVYKSYTPTNKPTYTPTISNCPLNSHISTADSTKCSCDLGYQTNTAKTGCIIDSKISNNKTCINKYGLNSNWDGTLNDKGGINCGCNSGYQWNSGQTQCIVTPIAPLNIKLPLGCNSTQGWSATSGVPCSNTNVPITPIKTIETNQSTCTSGYSKNALDQCIENNQLCKNDFGENTKWGGKINNKNGPVCDCVTGYVWNKEGTICLASQIKKLGVVTPIKIEKSPIEIKEDTPNITNPDPINLNQEVPTNTITEVKPKSFWSKIKGWFGF